MEFTLNIAFNWLISLAIPLIIRYVVVRKPLSKRNAIIVTAVNFGIIVLIPTALSGVYQMNAGVYFMTLIVYYILENKGKVIETTTKDDDIAEKIDS